MSESKPVDRLVFVYAADTGKLSAIVDSAKKVLAIDGCSLCTITHGVLGERSEWKSCRAEIGAPIDLYHRDDMPADVAAAVDGKFPAVFARAGGELVQLLDAEALDRLRGSVSDFKARLEIHAAMRGLEIPTATAA